ncbi:MAG: KEOPS complex subunit Cgi121 [Nitrososphaeraceae archaeon]
MIFKKIKGRFIYFHPFLAINHINYRQTIEELRKEFLDSKVQIINIDSFCNLDHIIEVLKISLFAEERSIMAAKKIEIDFLMRIIGTNNIGNALKIGGIKEDSYNILIAINIDIFDTYKIKKRVDVLFGPSDDKILLNKEHNRKKIESFIRKFDNDFINEKILINFLTEQAVLVTN